MLMTLQQMADHLKEHPDEVFYFLDGKNFIFEVFPSRFKPGQLGFSYTLGPTNIGSAADPLTAFDVTPGIRDEEARFKTEENEEEQEEENPIPTDTFDQLLLQILAERNFSEIWATIRDVPGVYEALCNEYQEDVMERWKQ